MKKKILIFTAGSAGRELFKLIQEINMKKNQWEVIGYVDIDLKKRGKFIDKKKVYHKINKPYKENIYAICGIMDPATRKKIYNQEILKNNYKIPNLIHPSIIVPGSIKLGIGNIIFGNVHISYDVKIKNYCLISNFCDIGHNLSLGDHTTIMPSVSLGGNCIIKKETLIRSGALIHPNIKIGSNCKIGMGSLVIKDVKNNSSVVNYPRQIISNIKKN